MKRPSCLLCGSPCEYTGLNTSEGCENPDCEFYTTPSPEQLMLDFGDWYNKTYGAPPLPVPETSFADLASDSTDDDAKTPVGWQPLPHPMDDDTLDLGVKAWLDPKHLRRLR